MFVSLLLFCAVSHKGKGHSPRDKQMTAIYVVPDGGVQFNTERNCQPERPSYIKVSTFSIWLRSVRFLPGTNIHKHDIIWIFGVFFCPRSYHSTPEYSLETKTCYLPDWGMEENPTGFWHMWIVPPVLPGNLSSLGQIKILPLLQEFMK